MEGELSADDKTAIAWAWTTGSPTGQVLRARHERGENPAPTADELIAIRHEWEAAGRPPPERHVHRTAVELADGTTVTAVSFLGDDPYLRESALTFGLYLDAQWDPPWPHEHIDWPDFGVPADVDGLAVALVALLDRARTGERVEVGCLGGHGRTGTALACLAVLAGTPRPEAVEWVRANYCPRAVETDEQRALVGRFAPVGSRRGSPGGDR